MTKNCPSCGAICKTQASFCNQCGSSFISQDPLTPSDNEAVIEPLAEQIIEDSKEELILEVEEISKKSLKKQPKKKNKKRKKSKLIGFLKFMLTLICIAAVLFLLWITLGKWLTLHFHSNEVVESLNAGSLDFPGSHNSDYNELPDYAKEMLGENIKKEQENGPLLNAVLPYLEVERVEINWFRSGASIEYCISAPDVEHWFMSLTKEDIAKGQETLMKDLDNYLIIANRRKKNVTVEYTKSGLFSIDWQGNYETIEFADAISGGVNTAYNELYKQAIDEMEEMLK